MNINKIPAKNESTFSSNPSPSEPMSGGKKTGKTIIFDIFYLIIGAYIALIVLEKFKPGLVSNYIDLNKIIFILVPLGILCVLIGHKK